MDPQIKPFLRFQFRSEYFLLLLPLFFVLHGYTDHYGEIPVKDALFLTLEYMGYIIVTSLIFSLLFRSVRKAAVFTVIFFSFFFFFGAVHDWLKEHLEGSFLTSYTFILPFSAAAFGLLALFLIRSARAFNRLTRYLNAMLLILVLIDMLVSTTASTEAKPANINPPYSANKLSPDKRLCDTCTGEDIHLIVVDEYAGSRELKEVFRFDNAPFEDSLRRRGFYVMDSSRSNYNYTVASMASFFSIDYLPHLTGKPVREIYKTSKTRINSNKFISYLIGKGYSIKNYSVFNFAGQPPFAEPYFPQHTELITGNTFLSRLKNDIGYHAALTLRIRSELEEVKSALKWEAEAESRKMDSVLRAVATTDKSPRFYYTHFMMPHDPYLYDKDENLLRLEALLDPEKKRDEHQLYLQYLQYTNKKLLWFIDKIQKVSAKPPVILLISDHGLRDDRIPVPYHFSNIAAVFLPNGDYSEYYPGLSNVNQLRVLLNKQFGERLPLLKDSSIYLGSKTLINEPL